MRTDTHESQLQICRRLLKAGKKLTPRLMFKNYGIMRLAARISDLKAEGMSIHSELVVESPVRFARYSLKK